MFLRADRRATVAAVCSSGTHTFSKVVRPSIRLVAGLGVDGDAHAGVTVQHRSRVAADPSQPNLRQVHILHEEVFERLKALGFAVQCGDLGENVTTRGLDVLSLPVGTRLHLGAGAVVELTGLRNPCTQLDRWQRGLMAALLDRDGDGTLVRLAGVMGIVVAGGEVRAGDGIGVDLPPPPYRALERV